MSNRSVMTSRGDWGQRIPIDQSGTWETRFDELRLIKVKVQRHTGINNGATVGSGVGEAHSSVDSG